MKVQIELGFKWEVGKLGLNEVVYRVDELAPKILTQVVEQLVSAYQEVIVDRLKPGHSSSERAGLGRTRGEGSVGGDVPLPPSEAKGIPMASPVHQQQAWTVAYPVAGG